MSRRVLPLLILLVSVVGCVLKWDRQWADGGAAVDGPQAADGVGELQPPKPDAKVITPDLGPTPCKGKSPNFVCRSAKGPCDVEETCDGKSHDCPPDKLRPKGDVCRSSGGPCDIKETCDGKGKQCPADAFQPKTKACRTGNGSCDPAETCTGKSASCPPNVKWAQKQMLFSTKSGTDGYGVKKSDGKLVHYTNMVRVFCKPDSSSSLNPQPSLARGFLSFNLTGALVGATIAGAKLSGCYVGGTGGGSASIELYSTSFKVPVPTTVYSSPLTKLKTTLPHSLGSNSVSVPVGSVKVNALTQYMLLWPTTSCTTFSGQNWSGAGNAVDNTKCGKPPHPWTLAVTYCGP